MTRINLVPPEELTDQHLFAEFREIKMVPKALKRSIQSAERYTSVPNEYVLHKIPTDFTLNKGHVTFFYNKGVYLAKRYELLKQELERRQINFNRESQFDPDGTMLTSPWNGEYTPTAEALRIIRTRITEKINMKPEWYRYNGKPLITLELPEDKS